MHELRLALAALVAAAPLVAQAKAPQDPELEQLRQRFGVDAVRKAEPGVFEVTRHDGRMLRFSFGREGLASDIARLEKDLANSVVTGKGDPEAEARMAASLESLQRLRDTSPVSAKATDTSGVCGREATLHAGWYDGWTNASAFASTEVGIDMFGPPAPMTLVHHLFAWTWKTDPGGSVVSMQLNEAFAYGGGGASVTSVTGAGFGQFCTLDAFSAVYVTLEGLPFTGCAYPGDHYKAVAESGPCPGTGL